VASALAIEPRDPFLDVRVVQFCLSLPPEQLQAGGWPKLILRRAMRGLLPEPVIWRAGKEHLGWTFTLALFDRWRGWSEKLQSGISLLQRFLGATLLGGGNHRRGKGLDTEERIKLFFLLRWLRRSDTDRPATATMSGIEHVEDA
jgi:asparagine synthase (glutamine-hydrolysing)